MSGQGSGSRGQRRSDRLAKGKVVAYVPESSPDTNDEYDAMEDVHTRVDSAMARNLQADFDAEAAGIAVGAARPPSRPGVIIGRSARPSGAPRQPTMTLTGAPPARSKRQSVIALLFLRTLCQRTTLHRGLNILLGVAFDRAILSPFRRRIRLF